MHIQSDFFPACVKNALRSSKVYILVDKAEPTLHTSNTENFFKVNFKKHWSKKREMSS